MSKHQQRSVLAAPSAAVRTRCPTLFYIPMLRRMIQRAAKSEITEKNYVNLGFAKLVAPAVTVTRTQARISLDKVEEFCFVLLTNRRCEMVQRGNARLIEPGAMYAVNAGETYLAKHSAGAAMACLTAPCELIRPRVRGIDDLIVRADHADGMIAAAVRNLVEHALATTRVATDERVEALCLDMIDLMLTSKRA